MLFTKHKLQCVTTCQTPRRELRGHKGHRGHGTQGTRDTRDTGDTEDTRDTGHKGHTGTQGTRDTRDTRGHKGHRGTHRTQGTRRHRGTKGTQGTTINMPFSQSLSFNEESAASHTFLGTEDLLLSPKFPQKTNKNSTECEEKDYRYWLDVPFHDA